MKRIIKGISLFTIIVLSLLFSFPTNTSALTEQTSKISINDTKSFEVGELKFTNLSFKDYSSTSTQAFGISGYITNNSNSNIEYSVDVYFYDSNNNLITKLSNYKTAITGNSQFNQMFNLNSLNGHSVNEIAYYSLSVTTNDTSNDINVYEEIPSKNVRYSSYQYVIDKYDVNIVVNENNTFDITETITAYFNVPKHGIYRRIPLKNIVNRLDGTSSKNRARVTNLSVNNKYTTSRENGYLNVKIGSKNRTLTGEQTYVIKYTYNIGKDPVKDYDELYFNIIGDQWDTVIGNVSFTITMPKEFDSSKLGFSSGLKSSVNNDKISYNVTENKIIGSYKGILQENEALTVRCELPEGYFVGAGFKVNSIIYIICLIPIIFLGISIMLWYKFGRDDQVVETVEFYPLNGFNSLELGFLYRGKAESQDVISLLIYLANKGYIKIAEIEEKGLLFKHKGFKITKLKEYDGNNINEKKFLDGLFSVKYEINMLYGKSNEQSNPENLWEVTSDELYNNFYITINEILSNINKKENRQKIFEKTASNKSIFIVLMVIATFCIITIPPLIAFGDTSLLIFSLLFPGIGFTVLFKLVFGETQTIYVNGRATYSSKGTKIFGIIWGLGFGGIPWAFFVLPFLLVEPIYLISYLIGLACVGGMIISLSYLPKRTPYGNEVLGKIRGFKNFLETAEKERLELMVMQNPTYFYDILPYAYVLGVTDKWIKNFENISMQAPAWYDSPNVFDMATFSSFMSSTMSSAESTMVSSPSSSGSSGGGFSGGGSGGGGGGSW